MFHKFFYISIYIFIYVSKLSTFNAIQLNTMDPITFLEWNSRRILASGFCTSYQTTRTIFTPTCKSGSHSNGCRSSYQGLCKEKYIVGYIYFFSLIHSVTRVICTNLLSPHFSNTSLYNCNFTPAWPYIRLYLLFSSFLFITIFLFFTHFGAVDLESLILETPSTTLDNFVITHYLDVTFLYS